MKKVGMRLFTEGMSKLRDDFETGSIESMRAALKQFPTNSMIYTLVQLSDLHIGPRVDDADLLHTFERVKKLAPEIVVYTGDFTSYETDVFTHAGRDRMGEPSGVIRTRERLGGLLKFYYREAA